jgi:ABC-type uncharacterized transport system substrate-binding protein
VPLFGRAQQANKLPTIGFLGNEPAAWNPWTAAFVERLRALGWIEGRSIAIDYRWWEGRAERAAEIAAEFVRLKVDIIVTAGSAVPAAKQATSDIPIVFAISDNPVTGGLVASLARPGGNLTGLATQATEMASKRLDLLREMIPRLRRLAIMLDGRYSENIAELAAVTATAGALGIELVPLEIRRAEEIAPAFESLKGEADALYLVPSALLAANSTRIITFTLSTRLPTMFAARDRVQAGGLISYGPDFVALFRRTAEFVDKILRGTKPGDIPVEQPTKFELVVNLTTARALGLAVPTTLLAIADEVVE